MAGQEYAHQLGQMLESCSAADERIAICRLLAATASPDAQGYLVDALAEETDDGVIAAIKAALSELGQPRCE